MWFKNIQIYTFKQPITTDAETLATQLDQHRFTPCGATQPSTAGWTSPLGRTSEELVHAGNGYMMVCLTRQDRLLPAGVINEELEDRVAQIEAKESRKVTRKERTDLKEEITFEFLPRAFLRSTKQYAYLSLKDQMLIVDAASEKKADDFVAALRQSTGSLPVVPIQTHLDPVSVMTDWVRSAQNSSGSSDGPFEAGGECELRYNDDISRTVRCKNQDLGSEEIQQHLNVGMHVSKLALHWLDRLDCVLDEKLNIKRLRFTDVVQEIAANESADADDAAAKFDVDFSIMTLELSSFIAALSTALGGIVSANPAPDSAQAPQSSGSPKTTERNAEPTVSIPSDAISEPA